MTPRIKITEESSDGMTVEEWSFYLLDDNLVLYLDLYRRGTRTTRRQKFKYARSQCYERLGRESDRGLNANEVPIPDKVRAAAVEQVVSLVRVDLWENRRR